MPRHPLDSLFAPHSIAVFGASGQPESVGGGVLKNLREGGYGGPLFAINPHHDLVHGIRCYPDIGSIGLPVELAVIAIPAVHVAALLGPCALAGVRAAIVISAGFSEIGPEGVQLQDELLAVARKHGIRLLGPNCLGLMRPPAHVNASFGATAPISGRLALVSQSGAVCTALVDWARQRELGFSAVVSLGAASDVDLGDVLDYLALDPHTDAILLYAEGIARGRKLMSGLRAAARMKPVIVVKAGRHQTSARAVTSHTGALSGNDLVFDAAVRRAGAVRVHTLEQLFSTAELLGRRQRVDGPRLAIVTGAGGLGVLAADRAADLGVELAQFGPTTEAALARLLPAHAARSNPVDVLGDASSQRLAEALAICIADGGVDGVLVMLTPQAMTSPLDAAKRVAEVSSATHKPVLACFLGGRHMQAAQFALTHAQVPQFDSPEAAVEAFAALVAHGRNQRSLMQVPEIEDSGEAVDIEAARAITQGALDQGRQWLNPLEGRAVLAAFRIPSLPIRMAQNADQAAQAAEALGFPVALKIDAELLTHKSEVDGVRLGIRDVADVRAEFAAMIERVQQLRPDAAIRGVSVEPMHRKHAGRELLVGISRDSVFGPTVGVGLGGVRVEILRDYAVGLPPLNAQLASDLLSRTRAHAALGAFRGAEAANVEQVLYVLQRIAELACELPEVVELDINPLVVDADGALAVDVRVRLERVQAGLLPYHHMAIVPYPRQLVQHIVLSDGTPLTLRPIRPEDARIEQTFVRGLSNEAKRFRFMQSVHELTPQMLMRFTQLDYDREMAFVAVTVGAGAEAEVGVSRYVTMPDGETCEFAIVVADAWHGRGLGTRLMRALIDAAKAKGLLRMFGEVLAHNVDMLVLCRELGFVVRPVSDDPGVLRVELAL